MLKEVLSQLKKMFTHDFANYTEPNQLFDLPPNSTELLNPKLWKVVEELKKSNPFPKHPPKTFNHYRIDVKEFNKKIELKKEIPAETKEVES